MISKYLQQILSARYGKDVRQSIHDGIKEIDGVARAAQNSATANAQTASAKASEALTASQEALKKAQEAQASAQQAKVYAENAEAVTGVNIGTKDRAGIVKGGENHIAEDGTLELVVKTTETTMPNSRKGRVEVVEIGGVCEQVTTTGSQLFDGTLESGYRDSIGGDLISANAIYRTIDFEITEPGEYTFTFDASTLVIRQDGKPIDKSGTLFVYNLEAGPHYISFRRSDNAAWNNSTKIMLNKGNVALPYEPYTGGSPAPSPSYPQEIKKSVVSEIKTHGKNIVKHNATNQVIYGVTFKPNADGSISVSGTATDVAIYMIRNYDIKDLKYGTSYILSGCPNGGSATTFALSTNSGDYAQSVYDFGEGSTFSLNKSNMTNFALFIRVYKGTTVNTTFYPMIREASVADGTYEPYTESSITLSNPIDLYGIGDVQDVIEDGKVKRRFAEVVFDGSDDEGWQGEKGTDFIRFFITLSKLINGASNTRLGNLICSHGVFANGAGDATIFGYNDGTSSKFYIYANSIQSVDAWKAHLQSKPMTLVYEVAEEETELPIADQIALNSLATFDGITYLEFDSEVQPTFKGNYGASLVGGAALEGLLIARNNELRITALEA